MANESKNNVVTGAVEIISSEEFKNEIFNFETGAEWSFEKDQPVILNFFATWCGPCQYFAPVLDSIAAKYPGALRVCKIDIDVSPEVPALFGVRSVPTTVFIKRGEEPALAMGAMSEEGMKNAIKDLFGDLSGDRA